jgi:hypothetical protein
LLTLSFPIDIFIRDGVIDLTVTGVGAREPLVVSKNVAPEKPASRDRHLLDPGYSYLRRAE